MWHGNHAHALDPSPHRYHTDPTLEDSRPFTPAPTNHDDNSSDDVHGLVHQLLHGKVFG